MSEQIHFVELRHKSDFESLEPFAAEIWRSHYTPIIGADQVAYMLDKYQRAEVMWDQSQQGVRYFWMRQNMRNFGYLAFYFIDEGNALFVSKLYVHDSCRRKGMGSAAIDFLKSQAMNGGVQSLELTVNKNNFEAIGFYQRIGFSCIAEIVVSIGAGFVMDDYRMRLDW